jgi:hypothetical protein
MSLVLSAAIGGVASASGASFSFAFIGDAPYGPVAQVSFPQLVSDINLDPQVSFVAHAGDIKNGSSSCSNAALQIPFDLYQTFEDPFWYTPGDNEWTDCHRTNNGGFLPIERLAYLRQLFYPVPGQTTGGTTMAVNSQGSSAYTALQPFVENTWFQQQCVTFGAVHVVGSNDNGSPWSQYPGNPALLLAPGDQPALRTAELTARRAAALAWIDQVFNAATANNSDGVFLMMQAEPAAGNAEFAAVRSKVLSRAVAFGKPVILGHGDDHVYTVTPNYGGVANLTRLEVPGDVPAQTQWLKVNVACGSSSVFSWTVETIGPDPVIPEGPLAPTLLATVMISAAAVVVRRRSTVRL